VQIHVDKGKAGSEKEWQGEQERCCIASCIINIVTINLEADSGDLGDAEDESSASPEE
jgi:hypothetical protein